MRVSRRLLTITAATFAVAPTAVASPRDALDGVWQGTLTQLRGAELSESDEPWPAIRIEIGGVDARVFLVEGADALSEIKPGAFRIARLADSALITAIDSSSRAARVEEGWVESWSISITIKAENVLSAVLARQVNNLPVPRGEPEAYFNMALAGELQRLTIGHV